MKDTSAFLLTVLARRDPALFAAVFDWGIDTGRMLRTFVQITRSGQTGRRSLGSRPKSMGQAWLNAASDKALPEPLDTILTSTTKRAALEGGGTNCSAPLAWLNAAKMAPDLVIFVSDNPSWVDARNGGQGTAMMAEWAELKAGNPRAKLVCIDIQLFGTTQAAERADVLNIGGFSDAVFGQIAAFAAGEMGADHWVGQIVAGKL